MADILDLLGSSTRRKILKMLSNEPCYLSEISKILGIGHKAIMSHLNLMEGVGLLKSYDKETKKAPNRKYYKIASNRGLWVRISSSGYETKVYEPEIDKIDIDSDKIDSISQRYTSIKNKLDEIRTKRPSKDKLFTMSQTISDIINLKSEILGQLYALDDWLNYINSDFVSDVQTLFGDTEADILSAIALGNNTLDQIEEKIGLNPYHILYILNELEKERIIEKRNNKWYLINEKPKKE